MGAAPATGFDATHLMHQCYVEKALDDLLCRLNKEYSKGIDIRDPSHYFDEGLRTNILNCIIKGKITEKGQLEEGLRKVFAQIYSSSEDRIKSKPRLATSIWNRHAHDCQKQRHGIVNNDDDTAGGAALPSLSLPSLPPPAAVTAKAAAGEKARLRPSSSSINDEGGSLVRLPSSLPPALGGGDAEEKTEHAEAEPAYAGDYHHYLPWWMVPDSMYMYDDGYASIIKSYVDAAIGGVNNKICLISESGSNPSSHGDWMNSINLLTKKLMCLHAFEKHLEEEQAAAAAAEYAPEVRNEGNYALFKYLVHGDVTDVQRYLRAPCCCCCASSPMLPPPLSDKPTDAAAAEGRHDTSSCSNGRRCCSSCCCLAGGGDDIYGCIDGIVSQYVFTAMASILKKIRTRGLGGLLYEGVRCAAAYSRAKAVLQSS